MKNLAYIRICEGMTPLMAAEKLKMAKDNGFDEVLVLHEENAPFYESEYREKLLALLRGAYRSKVKLYIGDDDSDFISGTGFGQVSSVREVKIHLMRKKKKEEVCEGEEIVAEKDDCCIVKFVSDLSYPDTTNALCAELVIDCVYAPLIREFVKFIGYEFAGFYCKNPQAPTALGVETPYMQAVVDKFQKEKGRLPDFFSLVDKTGDFEEYSRLADVCVEENFLLALKDYCEKNKVTLAVGSMDCEHLEFCRKHSLMHMGSYGAKGGYILNVEDTSCVLECPIEAEGFVMPIGYGMNILAKLWAFRKKHPNTEIINLEDFNNCEKDCYIIRRGSGHGEKRVSFLLEDNWCVLDWEKDAVYDFDKKKAYDFTCGGFLWIKRKKADMYSEKLPVKVGGVLTAPLECTKKVDFTQEDNRFYFTLPEESLTGKHVEISHNGEYMALKMGYNKYESICNSHLFPLFDFLCGEKCEGIVFGGSVSEIAVYEKTID